MRPHPHIGLATVTFLFEGEIVHRDSLGHVQTIRPGAVNLMTAGRGIVHSERSPATQHGGTIHGIQLWLALPAEGEETEPAFVHYPADGIPVVQVHGVRVTVIMGAAFGERSPVVTASPTLYVEARFGRAGRLIPPTAYSERAVYVVEGELTVGSSVLGAGDMGVLRPGADHELEAAGPAHAMIIGGEPFPEQRTIWWNFVSSSPERIEQAKRQWREGRFEPVPGETEFIPLPEE